MTKIILPSYTTKLPSTGKTVEFRPFTIREEKALLLALEENSITNVANVIKNTIKVCTDGKIDPDNTPYYDIEFLFLQIRSKSVGEYIDLIGTCKCAETPVKNEYSVDITTPIVEPCKVSNVIRVEDTPYTVVLRHPTLNDFVSALNNESDSGTSTVASCIKLVYTDDEEFEWNQKEKLDFVESMTPKQQKKIAEYLDAMPTIKIDASYTCRSCGVEHKQYLTGFENFFV